MNTQATIGQLRQIITGTMKLQKAITRITGLTAKQSLNIARGQSKPSAPAAKLISLFVSMTEDERRQHFPSIAPKTPRGRAKRATTPDNPGNGQDGTAKRVIATAQQIQAGVRAVAERIKATIKDDNVLALVLMHGGMFYAADLLRQLPPSWEVKSARVFSYGNAKTSGGKVHWAPGALPDVTGRTVLIIDEICDSGLTLQQVIKFLPQAAKVYTTVAVLREGSPLVPDFPMLTTGPGFLVGYGMDTDGRQRGLPYIYAEPGANGAKI